MCRGGDKPPPTRSGWGQPQVLVMLTGSEGRTPWAGTGHSRGSLWCRSQGKEPLVWRNHLSGPLSSRGGAGALRPEAQGLLGLAGRRWGWGRTPGLGQEALGFLWSTPGQGRQRAAMMASPGTVVQVGEWKPSDRSRGTLRAPVEQSGLGGWNPESGHGVPEVQARPRLAPFLWRWARPREVSSPLVRAVSGGLLLAASLLVSSPRRLSEPQACRAQGAASHSPRAGQ